MIFFWISNSTHTETEEDDDDGGFDLVIADSPSASPLSDKMADGFGEEK